MAQTQSFRPGLLSELRVRSSRHAEPMSGMRGDTTAEKRDCGDLNRAVKIGQPKRFI